MIKNEKLVLVGKAFEDQIKAAQVALEDNFRTPIRTWLKTLKDRERIVDDTVKAFIRPILATDPCEATGSDLTTKACDKAIKTGKFDKAQLTEMYDKGLLVPIGGPELADWLVDHGIGSRAGYTILIPGTPAGWTEELRLQVMAKGRYTGLKASLQKTLDLEALIIKAANDIDSVPISTAALPAGKVAIKTP